MLSFDGAATAPITYMQNGYHDSDAVKIMRIVFILKILIR